MWAIPVIVRRLSGKGPEGKNMPCFKGCTVILSCVTVALTTVNHFAKQPQAENKVYPVSNASKVCR